MPEAAKEDRAKQSLSSSTVSSTAQGASKKAIEIDLLLIETVQIEIHSFAAALRVHGNCDCAVYFGFHVI